MRKTIQVDKVRRKANDLLALSANDPDTRPSKEFRIGVMLLIEHVLHETGNYRGFKYLQPEDNEQIRDDSLRSYL